MIFYRREFKDAIDFAVFPSLQGGPHNHQVRGYDPYAHQIAQKVGISAPRAAGVICRNRSTVIPLILLQYPCYPPHSKRRCSLMGLQITALAVALKEAASPSFKDYIVQVKRNAVALAEGLRARGHKVVTDGTENHLVLWDVRPHDVTGSKVEKVLERCGISVNKNTIAGDRSAAAPGGVRVGTPAMTTRGMTEEDFDVVASLLDRGLRVAVDVQAKAASRKLVDFEKALQGNEEVERLRREVEQIASKLPFPS